MAAWDGNSAHGSATITSNPSGAEIFLDERSLGRTPLTVDLPLGQQTLSARHPKYPKRSETVTVTEESPVNLAFQFRTAGRSSSRKAKPTPTPTAINKIGKTLKKFFGPKPSPTPPKKKKKR